MENLNFNNLPKSEKELPKEKDSQTEQRELDKREKVFLEIEGQNIEAEKSYFEYPERIQKETLIKGYTKYKIQKSIIESIEESNDKWANRDLQDKVLENICATLSNGEFPSKTYNHRIQADDGGMNIKKGLIEEKIILGEISGVAGDYDTLKSRDSTTISAVVDTNGEVIRMGDFMHSKKDGAYNFMEFKGTKHDIETRNDIRVGKAWWPDKMSMEEFDNLTKGNIIISTMSGLYLRHKKVWGYMSETPSFGFDVNEKPFKDYLHKVEEIYSKLPEDIFSEKNAESLNHLVNDKGNLRIGEVILPVMTGNTGLPALRWGHAKYVVVPTEKNFNFLIMDHLSLEEENNSSDS